VRLCLDGHELDPWRTLADSAVRDGDALELLPARFTLHVKAGGRFVALRVRATDAARTLVSAARALLCEELRAEEKGTEEETSLPLPSPRAALEAATEEDVQLWHGARLLAPWRTLAEAGIAGDGAVLRLCVRPTLTLFVAVPGPSDAHLDDNDGSSGGASGHTVRLVVHPEEDTLEVAMLQLWDVHGVVLFDHHRLTLRGQELPLDGRTIAAHGLEDGATLDLTATITVMVVVAAVGAAAGAAAGAAVGGEAHPLTVDPHAPVRSMKLLLAARLEAAGEPCVPVGRMRLSLAGVAMEDGDTPADHLVKEGDVVVLAEAEDPITIFVDLARGENGVTGNGGGGRRSVSLHVLPSATGAAVLALVRGKLDGEGVDWPRARLAFRGLPLRGGESLKSQGVDDLAALFLESTAAPKLPRVSPSERAVGGAAGKAAGCADARADASAGAEALRRQWLEGEARPQDTPREGRGGDRGRDRRAADEDVEDASSLSSKSSSSRPSLVRPREVAPRRSASEGRISWADHNDHRRAGSGVHGAHNDGGGGGGEVGRGRDRGTAVPGSKGARSSRASTSQPRAAPLALVNGPERKGFGPSADDDDDEAAALAEYREARRIFAESGPGGGARRQSVAVPTADAGRDLSGRALRGYKERRLAWARTAHHGNEGFGSHRTPLVHGGHGDHDGHGGHAALSSSPPPPPPPPPPLLRGSGGAGAGPARDTAARLPQHDLQNEGSPAEAARRGGSAAESAYRGAGYSAATVAVETAARRGDSNEAKGSERFRRELALRNELRAAVAAARAQLGLRGHAEPEATAGTKAAVAKAGVGAGGREMSKALARASSAPAASGKKAKSAGEKAAASAPVVPSKVCVADKVAAAAARRAALISERAGRLEASVRAKSQQRATSAGPLVHGPPLASLASAMAAAVAAASATAVSAPSEEPCQGQGKVQRSTSPERPPPDWAAEQRAAEWHAEHREPSSRSSTPERPPLQIYASSPLNSSLHAPAAAASSPLGHRADSSSSDRPPDWISVNQTGAAAAEAAPWRTAGDLGLPRARRDLPGRVESDAYARAMAHRPRLRYDFGGARGGHGALMDSLLAQAASGGGDDIKEGDGREARRAEPHYGASWVAKRPPLPKAGGRKAKLPKEERQRIAYEALNPPLPPASARIARLKANAATKEAEEAKEA